MRYKAKIIEFAKGYNRTHKDKLSFWGFSFSKNNIFTGVRIKKPTENMKKYMKEFGE